MPISVWTVFASSYFNYMQKMESDIKKTVLIFHCVHHCNLKSRTETVIPNLMLIS